MKINDVTIDEFDHIVDMSAEMDANEAKFFVSLALNMLYASEKMYFNMHTAEWEFSPDVYAAMGEHHKNTSA